MTQPQPKEKKVLLNIIEQYKNMPFLWNQKHKNYKNKVVRNEGNKVLLDLYVTYDSNATLKTLVKKIQNLRTGYFKELKKVKESRRTGAGADEVYVPTLWYFEAMSFLGSVSEPRRRGWVWDAIETDDFSTSEKETESIPRSFRWGSASPSPRKKKRVTKANIRQKHDSLLNTADRLDMKEEEWEIIGKAIGLQLVDLNRRQFFIAQKIIHDTLYYAQMEMLGKHTSVTGLEHTQSPHPTQIPQPQTSSPQQVNHQHPLTSFHTQQRNGYMLFR